MMTVQEQTTIDTIMNSGIFDVDYYTQQTDQKFASPQNAVEHYLAQGAAKNLNPHPLFDTIFYLNENKDVANAGVNPLLHYILQGGLENRKPCEQFDGPFYLRNNPDVKALKSNPLSHFILLGAEEGRKPNAIFDSAFYLSQYPEVKESGINPLVHYITRGQAEGRRVNSRPLYPRELYLQMRKLEPLLPPYAALQTLRESKESFISNAGLVYEKLKAQIIAPFSHLYVVANNSGSLAEVANLMPALAQAKAPNKALVVVSGRAQNETERVIKQLQSSAMVVSLQNFDKKLEPEEELQIICRLAVQAEPRVLHAIDSRVCLDLFRRMHKPLSLKSKLFATVRAFSTDDEGIASGPNLFLSPCADALTAVFATNEEVRAELINQIGFDQKTAERIIVLGEKQNNSIIEKLKHLDYLLTK